jgi:NADPH-dependent glutamate synthase beta subunit-like oxidoreductase
MGKQITFDKKEDLPLVTSSFESMAWNKTGDWRYLKPIFQDKTPPCNNSCPAGEDVQGYLYLAQKKKYKEAWNLIKEENPLPAVCGRACMHPCEDSCNRGEFDEPINISAIERFLADNAIKQGYILPPIKRKKKKEKIAIIGSGPAGLSCAYQLKRIGYQVTIFEALPALGGMLRIGIPDYRLPKDILEHEIDTILELGIQIQTKARIDKETIAKDMKDFHAIFIATGCHKSIRLGIAGGDSRSVISGLDFLKDIHFGKKVPLGKKVAVIGGGNTAIDTARLALRLGAKPFILYRRTPAEMPAIKSEVIQAENEGIEISYLTAPTRIISKGNRVTALECVKNRTGPPDSSGNKTLIEIKDSHFPIEVDNIISAIGEIPDISILPEEVDLENRLIVTDESLKTTMNGVFAGGDVKSPLRSIAHAIGSGKRAAIAIDRYLKAKTLEDVMDTIRIGDGPGLSMRSYLQRDDPSRRKTKQVVRYKDINIDYFEQKPRHAVKTLSIEERVSSKKEVHLGFPCETALQEAGRCFNCGVCNHCDNCYIFCSDLAVIKHKGKTRNTIDYDHCKGCGVCIEECPRDAMYMEREEK